MQLSVIILNYKVPYHLLQCIESAQRSSKDLSAEIIVVDNHSQDESCDLVREYFPEVKLIVNKSNDGFSKGNNIGIAQAQGKYICLLNPDTAVGENCFKNFLDFAEKYPDFGAIGPKLIDGRGNFLPESKRNIPTPKVALKKLLNNSKAYYSDLGENETGPIEILAGAFMLMRKDRYLEVGGLDEDYFMYGEDIDLSYKFLKAGYQNYYFAEEKVLHYKGESTAKDETYRKRFYDAMMIFYQKHFDSNPVSRSFVNFGLKAARLTHGLRKKKENSSSKFKAVISIGFGENSIRELQPHFEQKIIRHNLEDLDHFKDASSLFIFNAEKITYEDIFDRMEKLAPHHHSFRIKPKNLNFLIGSDDSNVQGKLLFLDSEAQQIRISR